MNKETKDQQPSSEFTTKIKKRWLAEAPHTDSTLDYAICAIVGLCDRLATSEQQPSLKQPNSEFIEGARALLRQGANDEQWEFATLLRKACDRLGTSETENRRVNAGWAMESQLRENLLQENYNYETKIKELKIRLV